MGWAEGHAIHDALEDLLERERALILAGDFDGLARLTPEKEAGVAGFIKLPGDRATLDRIRQAAGRNQSLLDAAARGLRAARARLAALERPGAGLRTYGRDGVPSDLAGPPSAVIRRA